MRFTTLEGKSFSMQDLRGKVVLVKFWATSCVTCVKQMPETISAYNEYAAKGYEAIAVAMNYDPPNFVLNFAETRKLPFPVALDTKGDIARAFGDIRLTPTAFLIDKQGRIIKRYLGEYDVPNSMPPWKRRWPRVEPRSILIRPRKTAQKSGFFVWLEKLARLRTPAPRRPCTFPG